MLKSALSSSGARDEEDIMEIKDSSLSRGEDGHLGCEGEMAGSLNLKIEITYIA